jgi:hypothetical protein
MTIDPLSNPPGPAVGNPPPEPPVIPEPDEPDEPDPDVDPEIVEIDGD